MGGKNNFLKDNFFAKVVFAAGTFFCISQYNAQTINVGGTSWGVSVPALSTAGSNYSGTYENPNQFVLNGNIPGNILSILTASGIRITVQHNPSFWNSNLKLYARRNGGQTRINGLCFFCSSSISGGNNYLEIPQNASTTFSNINFSGVLGFSNSLDYFSLNVQTQISGVSVTVPAANYNTTVFFTILAN